MNGYYSVFNPRGEKIADCGIERDAVTLMSMRNSRWDGHYFTFVPSPGDIVDVGSLNRLPSNQKQLEWVDIPVTPELNQSTVEAFSPE